MHDRMCHVRTAWYLCACLTVSLTLCAVCRERERERRVQCTVSLIKVISVLTQWGATLVIKIRERRERESHTSGDINKV